mgnify:CR=1 FL=1
MKVVAQIDEQKINDMPLSITITMTVEEWRKLMRQQDDSWPASMIGQYIAGVLGHIEKSTNIRYVEPLHETPE